MVKSRMKNTNSSSKRAFPKTEGLGQKYNIPLSAPLIRKKTLEMAKETGFEDFKASMGWLDKFRTRHNISYKNICGEGKCKEKMNDLCETYSEKDPFNFVSSLLYQIK
ncbi:hypothetical protein PR048_002939 [Dryococelus australis]|uniref:HTH CENPB-type domain-containing protein n=1 Tax=Dryococelus australis TaxID=614101 RepID=A0ABQ9ILJ9_9NEOP|nr:hypothetical protein PR048_002939 [Dryococelus australis]